MTTGPNPDSQQLYWRVLDYLPVLSEEQITRLRDLAIGVEDVDAFSEEEISDLEHKSIAKSSPILNASH
jgi:hypothetical protein